MVTPECTLVILKPDTVQRAIVGQIISRFEQKGFRIAGMRMLNPTSEKLGIHYADDLVWKKSVGAKTREKMSSRGIAIKESDEEIGARIREWNMKGLQAPVIAIVFEGYHAVELGRKIVGDTEPRSALPGTIRGDFSTDSYDKADEDKRVVRGLVHASGSVKEAEREIKVWFKDEELFDYPRDDWAIMHG